MLLRGLRIAVLAAGGAGASGDESSATASDELPGGGDLAEELRQMIAEKELEAQVEERRHRAETEDKGDVMAALLEVMGKVREMQAAAPETATTTQHPSKALAEKYAKIFRESMSSMEAQSVEDALQHDELHACLLMSARHARAAGTFTNEVQSVVDRFVADEAAVTAREVSRNAYFQGVAFCLKELTKDELGAFEAGGGFEMSSELALPESVATKLQKKKPALLESEVFKLRLNRTQWPRLRRLAAMKLTQPTASSELPARQPAALPEEPARHRDAAEL